MIKYFAENEFVQWLWTNPDTEFQSYVSEIIHG